MTAEFRTAKGWRWFIYLGSPPLIAFSVFVGFNALTEDTSNLAGAVILIVIAILVLYCNPVRSEANETL